MKINDNIKTKTKVNINNLKNFLSSMNTKDIMNMMQIMNNRKSLLGIFLTTAIVVLLTTGNRTNKEFPLTNEKSKKSSAIYKKNNHFTSNPAFNDGRILSKAPVNSDLKAKPVRNYIKKDIPSSNNIRGVSINSYETAFKMLAKEAFNKNLTDKERSRKIHAISKALKSTYDEEKQILMLKEIAKHPSNDAFFIIESVMMPSYENPSLSNNAIEAIRYLEDDFFLPLVKEKFVGSQIMNDTSGHYKTDTKRVWKDIHLAAGDALANMALRGSVDSFLELLPYEESLNSPIISWIQTSIEKNAEIQPYIVKSMEGGNIKIHDELLENQLNSIVY